MIIRPALETDMGQIAAIYARHVIEGFGTFEIDPPDTPEMTRRRANIIDQGFPWLAAEDNDDVLGYAYAGPFRLRPAWRPTVESSVYVSAAKKRMGIGRRLMQELIAVCERAGFRQMIAVIGDGGNKSSIGLHAGLDFETIGTLKSVGFKHGRWLDCVFMQRALGFGDAQNPDVSANAH